MTTLLKHQIKRMPQSSPPQKSRPSLTVKSERELESLFTKDSLDYSNHQDDDDDDDDDESKTMMQKLNVRTKCPYAALEEPYPHHIGSKAASTSSNTNSTLPPSSPKGVDEDLDNLPFHFEEVFTSDFNPFRKTEEVVVTPQPTPEKVKPAAPTPQVSNASVAPVTAAPKEPNTNTSENENDSGSLELEHIFASVQPAAESSIEVVHVRPVLHDNEIGQASITIPEASAKAPQQASTESTAGERHTSSGAILFGDAITSKLRLYIDDYDSPFFSKLMYDLMGQPRIIKLDIYRGDQDKEKTPRTSKELALFFQMVQSLPNLRTLHLSNLDATADMDHFHEAVYSHPKLQFLRLHLANGPVDPMTLRTLATIPQLTEVTLEASESFDPSLLLWSKSLQKLHIVSNDSYKFENAHVMPLVQMLEGSTTLQVLVMEPIMTCSAFKFLAYSLRVNRSVQVLRVAVERNSTSVIVDQVIQEIDTVLRLNTTLKMLHNLNDNAMKVSMSRKRSLLKTMEINASLDHFVFFDEDTSFTNKKYAALIRQDTHTMYSGRNLDEETCSSYTFATATVLTTVAEEDNHPAVTSPSLSNTCGVFEQVDLSPYVRETKRIFSQAQTQGEQLSKGLWHLIDKAKAAVATKNVLSRPRTASVSFEEETVTFTTGSYSETDDATHDSEGTIRTHNNSIRSGATPE